MSSLSLSPERPVHPSAAQQSGSRSPPQMSPRSSLPLLPSHPQGAGFPQRFLRPEPAAVAGAARSAGATARPAAALHRARGRRPAELLGTGGNHLHPSFTPAACRPVRRPALGAPRAGLSFGAGLTYTRVMCLQIQRARGNWGSQCCCSVLLFCHFRVTVPHAPINTGQSLPYCLADCLLAYMPLYSKVVMALSY